MGDKPSKALEKARRKAAKRIATLNEKPLHAALKAWYRRPGDRLEVFVDGSLVDIVRDGLLVEIQTRNFFSIRRKLETLSEKRPVRLVYPLALEKWIVKRSRTGRKVLGRRKSPKRRDLYHLFEELVSIPGLLARPGFSLEVLFVREEEVRRKVLPRGRWGREWVSEERRLLEVADRRLFRTPADAAALLPGSLPDPFTTADLSVGLDRPRWLMQQMAYCLRAMGAIAPAGKRGNAILYRKAISRRPSRASSRGSTPR